MTNNPVLIAYTVKDKTAEREAIWRRIGVAFPHDKGAGLTVVQPVVRNASGLSISMTPPAD